MFKVGDVVIFEFVAPHSNNGKEFTIKTVKPLGEHQLCTFEEWEVRCPSTHLTLKGFKNVFNRLKEEV